MMAGMSKETASWIIKAAGSLIAMVLIWRLVDTALKNGIDGVMFFVGVAAIAGLGGYEVRWLIEAVRSKSTAKEK